MTEPFFFKFYETSPCHTSVVWLHGVRDERLAFKGPSIETVRLTGGKHLALLVVTLSNGTQCAMSFASTNEVAWEDATEAARWFESAMCEKGCEP